MPILGYFLYVGGTLLALLFVIDFYVPRQPAREEIPHTYNIPIAAAQAPGQPITFSGETRHFGTPPPMTIVDLAAKAPQSAEPAPEGSQKTAQALAQMAPSAQHATKPVRKKIARRKINPNPDNSFAQIPEEWRHRYTHTGMAFARPFSW
jgi:hypothetical protein